MKNEWVQSKYSQNATKWKLAVGGSDMRAEMYVVWSKKPTPAYFYLPKEEYVLCDAETENEKGYTATPLSIFESINDKLDTILALLNRDTNLALQRHKEDR
jgi:hypothetical protein